MLTPDGRAILHEVPIQNDGSLLVELTESMLSCPGKADAEIRIYDSEHDTLLSTMNFYICIEASVYEDGRILASDEYNALTALIERASKHYEYVIESAQKSAASAKLSEENAALIEDNVREIQASVQESERNAKESEMSASDSAALAAEQAKDASDSANDASQSKRNAENSAKESSDYAVRAESFAHGGTETRPGEEIDNAEYYYNQSRMIAESFSGALRPMGTITFAALPDLSNAAEGDMYNISDEFTTNDDFKENAGLIIPPGANIYKTADGKWDVLAGTPVTGIKGDSETTYRKGNVNLTAEQIGALPVHGNALSATKAAQDGSGNNIELTYLQKSGDSAENTAVFTSGDAAAPAGWTDVAVMASGEKHKSLFYKLSAMMKNVRWLYKMLNLLTCSDASVNVGYTTDGVTKSVANNTRTVMTAITISNPGYYILSADTNFSKNGTGFRLGTFSSTPDGTSNTGTGVNVPANSGGMTTIQNIYLAKTTAANSKIYFAVQQTSGAALNATTWIGVMPIRCV